MSHRGWPVVYATVQSINAILLRICFGASHARMVTSASVYIEPLRATLCCYLTWTGLSVVADAVNYVMRDFGVL